VENPLELGNQVMEKFCSATYGEIFKTLGHELPEVTEIVPQTVFWPIFCPNLQKNAEILPYFSKIC